MTSSPIKIVRPWPAEQPRPPVVHKDGASTPSRVQATPRAKERS